MNQRQNTRRGKDSIASRSHSGMGEIQDKTKKSAIRGIAAKQEADIADRT